MPHFRMMVLLKTRKLNPGMKQIILFRKKTKCPLMDVAPNQIASIAASLIPFLEHDDAKPALDGFEHDATGSSTA